MNDLICLDFETYYADDYSLRLKKYNTSGYVRDEQFLIHGCSFQHPGHKPYWVAGHDEALKECQHLDLCKRPVVAHNIAFDGFILHEHADIHCGTYLDTLSMARAVVGVHTRLGLDDLAQLFGIGEKIKGALLNTKNKRILTPQEAAELGGYCNNDVALCMQIYDLLLPYMPSKEMDLIDLTLRMFCTPELEVDTKMVYDEYLSEIKKKAIAVDDADTTAKVLGSNPQFAELLRSLGVEPPTKISARTGKEAYAFAKTDKGFKALLTHDDEAVQLAAEARMMIKSTINETRALRMYTAGITGGLPILLNYCAAHTFRWSGGDKMNPQNFTRKSVLRRSIKAPKGKLILVNDQSQIEARLTVWASGQEDVLQAFRDYDAGTGPDVYKLMAMKIYRIPLERITDAHRFIGKVATLGMGFGMGWKRLKLQLAIGFMGPPMEITELEARRIVNVYRSANPYVVNFWDFLGMILEKMATDKTFNYVFGPVVFKYESVILPSGLSLKYPYMKFDGEDVSYLSRYGRTKIWGGYFLENLMQALARCIISDNMLEIAERNFVATMTHDEIVSLASIKDAEKDFRWQQSIMTRPVSWAPGLPLAVDGGYAEEYSK
jgi:hypothetical protein